MQIKINPNLEAASTIIVGNLGYLGPVLARYLSKKNPSMRLVGFDNAYFSGCYLNPYEANDFTLEYQIYEDVRNVKSVHLTGIQNVIYLAAISNDPMGNIYETPTRDINSIAAIKFAELAKKNGVKNFIYASSCSVYGAGGDNAKNEGSPLNPLTAYAKSKIEFEENSKSLASLDFSITCLRFATACGASPRLRLDLVLNDFVASALFKKKIEILSDGTPWRPLIDVDDMCKAIAWGIDRDNILSEPHLVVNVGSDEWNYTILDIACAVESVIKNIEIKINKDAAPDKRSYKVDFSFYKSLAPLNYPHKSITNTITEVANSIQKSNFFEEDFRSSHLIRLNTLNYLRDNKKIDSDINWIMS
jgi:nucleoside-diphosphate-sugar epimerase